MLFLKNDVTFLTDNLHLCIDTRKSAYGFIPFNSYSTPLFT